MLCGKISQLIVSQLLSLIMIFHQRPLQAAFSWWWYCCVSARIKTFEWSRCNHRLYLLDKCLSCLGGVLQVLKAMNDYVMHTANRAAG